MKRIAVLACVAVLSTCVAEQFSARTTLAQDVVKKAGAKKSTYRKRLPNYYGQANLSKEQKSKIYGIQESYHGQIEALRQQIAGLESKRNSEVAAVLTDDQKKKVDELVAAAKAKAEARRNKKKSK